MSITRDSYIIFNGQNSNDFDLAITGMDTYNSPERDYTFTSVNGRNGDILVDNKRFKNITVEYTAVIGNTFKTQLPRIRKWLLGADGYCKLQDTYNIGITNHRKAAYSGGIEFTNIYDQGGSIKLKFNCKPQIFLASGEIPTAFPTKVADVSTWSSDYVPEVDTAPLLYIHGFGNVSLGYLDDDSVYHETCVIRIGFVKANFDDIPSTFSANTYYTETNNVYSSVNATSKTSLNSGTQYYTYIYPGDTDAPVLSAPTNVSLSADTIAFDEVTHATTYEFYSDGTSIGTYTPSASTFYTYVDCATFNAYGPTGGVTVSRNWAVSFEGEPVFLKNKTPAVRLYGTDFTETDSTVEPRWYTI